MPHTYPPAPPTLTGDNLTISRFLNSPAMVQRRLRTLAENRFIADVLLTGRYETTGGSLLYEQNESILTNKPPEAVGPGGEYPRATASPGPAALAAVTKWGQDVPITDEHIKRYGRRAVDVALQKVRNYIVKQVDAVSLVAIGAAVTQTQAVAAAWNNASRDILLDLMLSKAKIDGQDQGYDADTLVTTDEGYARIVSDQKIISGLARERDVPMTVTGGGEVTMIAGLRILATNNLPAGVKALVLDSTLLGGIAYERLESPEYQGDPANGVESWTRRDPDANDQWLVRGRRPVVPVVQEPNCGVAITGTALV
jgi:hypothetical protein